MRPEQILGQAITTTREVYVLGVLLYKLLAGVSPFVTASMRLTDIERAICEKNPPPSASHSRRSTLGTLNTARARNYPPKNSL